jgi:molecular chaperone Hsp33
MADELIRGLALEGRARVLAAVTTDTVGRLLEIHGSSPTVTAALGRIATGALLLAATLEKVTGKEPMLTMEVDGGGPAGRFVATASPAGWVRATVAHAEVEAASREDGKLDVAGVVGRSGRLTVTRDPGIGEPYRGVVSIVSGEIAKDLAYYLSESEQTPAAVALGVHVLPVVAVDQAGGFLVQLLPGVTEEEAEDLSQRVKALPPVTSLLQSGERPNGWFERLFPGGVQVLERQPVRFHCGCSQERVEGAIKLLGAEEIHSLMQTSRANSVGLTCEFCRTEYAVSTEDLARLLLEVETEQSQLRPS